MEKCFRQILRHAICIVGSVTCPGNTMTVPFRVSFRGHRTGPEEMIFAAAVCIFNPILFFILKTGKTRQIIFLKSQNAPFYSVMTVNLLLAVFSPDTQLCFPAFQQMDLSAAVFRQFKLISPHIKHQTETSAFESKGSPCRHSGNHNRSVHV